MSPVTTLADEVPAPRATATRWSSRCSRRSPSWSFTAVMVWVLGPHDDGGGGSTSTTTVATVPDSTADTTATSTPADTTPASSTPTDSSTPPASSG